MPKIGSWSFYIKPHLTREQFACYCVARRAALSLTRRSALLIYTFRNVGLECIWL